MIFKKPNKARYRNELRGNKDLKTKLLSIYIYDDDDDDELRQR
jgi:hypothetical protein